MVERPTLGMVLRTARQRLNRKLSEDSATEVRVLAEWAFGLSRLELVTRENEAADAKALDNFEAALLRRIEGEPVHRIIGARTFRGLNLALSKDTLEPRPDTETLVELVLDQLAASGMQGRPLSILDLGTGTGAIGLSLLAALPNSSAVLTDISSGALETASANASAHGLAERVRFVCSDWFDGVEGQFDLIVSNPPYIATSIVPTLDRDVREHDPHLALDGGMDGLDPYRTLSAQASAFLHPHGLVAVEIGYDQAAQVIAIFEAAGFRLAELRRDLGGRDRALAFALR
ncbi:MAG: peptide chain release factor N(5)-glutamine methyltransferase [Rhizobiaceae bacterium]